MTTTNGRETVLIVEDDEGYVHGIVLEERGSSVVMARSGDEGLRLGRQAPPAAILMDVSNPGLDGWTVTERLKGDPETRGRGIPVTDQAVRAASSRRRGRRFLQPAGSTDKPSVPPPNRAVGIGWRCAPGRART